MNTLEFYAAIRKTKLWHLEEMEIIILRGVRNRLGMADNAGFLSHTEHIYVGVCVYL